MAFCGKCGKEVNEGVEFCTGCGAKTVLQTNEGNAQNQNDLSSKLQGLNNTADTTATFEKTDIEQNKVMGVLAYLSWLVLIPIFAAPKSKFARFHANQGLILAISEIVWWIVQSVITSVLLAISWRLSFFAGVLSLVNIVFLVLAIIGIINAVNGKAKELPVIGKFRILK